MQILKIILLLAMTVNVLIGLKEARKGKYDKASYFIITAVFAAVALNNS